MDDQRQPPVLEVRLPRWKEKSLGELGAEQGVTAPQKLEELLGAGADLWKDDREFDDFVRGIYQRRKESEESGNGTP